MWARAIQCYGIRQDFETLRCVYYATIGCNSFTDGSAIRRLDATDFIRWKKLLMRCKWPRKLTNVTKLYRKWLKVN